MESFNHFLPVIPSVFSCKKDELVENTPVIPDSFEFNEPTAQSSINLNPEEWELNKRLFDQFGLN